MLTHSTIPKYAFIGTSSAGKTTMTYKTCGYLKEHGIRVDGILQQDRRLPFDPALLESHAEAQWWFITNMMTVENYLALQKGVDCLVSDRSVVDFYAYAETQWPTKMLEMFQLVANWAKTYRALIYLEPLKYDNDGVRPPDEFRMRVDQTLKQLLVTLPNVMRFESRDEAMRFIAIDTKLQTFGEAQSKVHLTGSWFKNKERVGSDFDFIILRDDMHLLPKELRDSFRTDDPEPVRRKHNDVGLVEIYHSTKYNIGLQVQDTLANLQTRLANNHN